MQKNPQETNLKNDNGDDDSKGKDKRKDENKDKETEKADSGDKDETAEKAENTADDGADSNYKKEMIMKRYRNTEHRGARHEMKLKYQRRNKKKQDRLNQQIKI